MTSTTSLPAPGTNFDARTDRDVPTYCVARELAVPASAEAVFEYLDDHRRLAAHMEKRTWRLAFGRLTFETATTFDGLPLLRWRGSVFGLPIAVDEVLADRRPPLSKRWQTIGTPQLWVIGSYAMGFGIAPRGDGALVRIELEYTLPARGVARVLGRLLGHGYAQWCVARMIEDLRDAWPLGTT